MFFKHFASKNQLPGLSVNGTLVENGLRPENVKIVNVDLAKYLFEMLDMFPGLILASINRCLLVYYKLFLLSTLNKEYVT